MRRVRSALAVKMPRGNDVSSSEKVSASTPAAASLSLHFNGGQREGESDHRRGTAELDWSCALNYRVFAPSPRKTKQVEFALAMCLPS
jgi:hypothetical protein